jgi:hypothetical protein
MAPISAAADKTGSCSGSYLRAMPSRRDPRANPGKPREISPALKQWAWGLAEQGDFSRARTSAWTTELGHDGTAVAGRP